ncbi:hypothetical protein PUG46_06920 [Erwiniaceae bacterium L1_55_4]|nr:hypothetical protein [Erwiniaceae bacterium L1_55_4]
MTIKIQKLLASGFNKENASIVFDGMPHLIYGPTDTGKSYIVECFRYCLGGRDKPKDIGFSEGYNTLSIQLEVFGKGKYTIFRDVSSNEINVFEGYLDAQPGSEVESIKDELSTLITRWSNAEGKSIITKRGVKGNVTAGDIRFLTIFDEIRTLDNVVFVGEDTNRKTRNASSISLVLSGHDDSDVTLPPSNDEINKAKGHVEAIEEQIESLKIEIPEGIVKCELEESLVKVDAEIKRINDVIKDVSDELIEIQSQQMILESDKSKIEREISSFRESLSRFSLLNDKYSNDISRLEVIKKAASIVPNFKTRACPLCLTSISEQQKHGEHDVNFETLSLASESEINKIQALQTGLKNAIKDVNDELSILHENHTSIKKEINDLLLIKNSIISPATPINKYGIDVLSNKKNEISFFIRTLDKIDALNVRLTEISKKTKKTRHKITRDLASSSTALCKSIKELLIEWKVPGVDTISYDDIACDIEINHRKRVSFGKGKRGIFLTAFMVCLMERAIQKGFPHSGFLIIDSPVVTYKDPKHANADDDEELLDESVKDHFYTWLGNNKTSGQVIVLENEEPTKLQRETLNHTEFVGNTGAKGRKGFFPM